MVTSATRHSASGFVNGVKRHLGIMRPAIGLAIAERLVIVADPLHIGDRRIAIGGEAEFLLAHLNSVFRLRDRSSDCGADAQSGTIARRPVAGNRFRRQLVFAGNPGRPWKAWLHGSSGDWGHSRWRGRRAARAWPALVFCRAIGNRSDFVTAGGGAWPRSRWASSAAAAGWAGCWSPRSPRPRAAPSPAAARHRAAAMSTRTSASSPAIGRIGIPVGEAVEKLIRDSDVVLEFTSPGATAEHAALAAGLGKAMVIGTTGLSPQQGDMVRQAARDIPIVWAPNMSLGVNVLLSVVEEAARRLGPDWDIEILEMHHRAKVDAPSGTALALGRAAAAGREVALDEVEQRARDGITGPRQTRRHRLCRTARRRRGGRPSRDLRGERRAPRIQSIARPTGRSSPRVRCAPRAGSPAARRGSMGSRKCWAFNRPGRSFIPTRSPPNG